MKTKRFDLPDSLGPSDKHICACSNKASSIKTCVHASVFFTQIVTSRTQRPRNTDVTLSQHEHVRAEDGTVYLQNSHIYNLPAVPPFYSGQSDLLTAA